MEKMDTNLTFELTLKLPDNLKNTPSDLKKSIHRAVMLRLDCFSRLLNLVISDSDLKYWQELDSHLIQLAFNLEMRGLNGATDSIKEQVIGIEDVAV